MTFYGIEKILKQLPSNIFLKDNEARYIFATKYWHHLKKTDDPNWSIRRKIDPEIRKDKQNAIEAHKKDLEIIETGKGYVTGIIGLIYNVGRGRIPCFIARNSRGKSPAPCR